MTDYSSQLRVGRYDSKNRKQPFTEGFSNILIHTSKQGVGALSPFNLLWNGNIIENVWQGSKVYKKVSAQHQVNQWNGIVKWDYPAEQHIDSNNVITPAYFKWRNKLFTNLYPIRYPNGYNGRHEAVCSLLKTSESNITSAPTFECLTYIQARKRIYCQMYKDVLPTNATFIRLQNRLKRGEHLQINEVDGPPYDPNITELSDINTDLAISGSASINITEQNVKNLLNNRSHSFGHGYVIATMLAGHPEWMD